VAGAGDGTVQKSTAKTDKPLQELVKAEQITSNVKRVVI
jgi:hypothetical protein